jgi:LemA protein
MKWALLAAIIVVLAWFVVTYNTLVSLRQRVAQAFGDIDVQLKQRHDLVPNLVETVRSYAAHEKATLEAVVQARRAAISAGDPGSVVQSEAVLQAQLGRLLALGEAYPDLKASANFQSLQVELAAIEDKLAAARRFFNNAVAEYNAAIGAIPAALFAGRLGFSPKVFFALDENRRAELDAPPTVTF